MTRYVLISDGSSDKALLNIINFLLKSKFPNNSFRGERVDFYRIPQKLKNIKEKIEIAIKVYEANIIFIHRDAEKDIIENRITEIDEAINELDETIINANKFIKIIPIRMTEAWLLFNEKALRIASGNPNGTIKLNLPAKNQLENLPDPKTVLINLICEASGLSGRRLKCLNPRTCIHLIAELIEDYNELNGLIGYDYLRQQIDALII